MRRVAPVSCQNFNLQHPCVVHPQLDIARGSYFTHYMRLSISDSVQRSLCYDQTALEGVVETKLESVLDALDTEVLASPDEEWFNAWT